MADKLLLQELILTITPLLSHFAQLSLLILIPQPNNCLVSKVSQSFKSQWGTLEDIKRSKCE